MLPHTIRTCEHLRVAGLYDQRVGRQEAARHGAVDEGARPRKPLWAVALFAGQGDHCPEDHEDPSRQAQGEDHRKRNDGKKAVLRRSLSFVLKKPGRTVQRPVHHHRPSTVTRRLIRSARRRIMNEANASILGHESAGGFQPRSTRRTGRGVDHTRGLAVRSAGPVRTRAKQGQLLPTSPLSA